MADDEEFEVSNCAREHEPRRNWCLSCLLDEYEECSVYGPDKVGAPAGGVWMQPLSGSPDDGTCADV